MIYHSKKGVDAWMKDKGFVTVKEYSEITNKNLQTVYKHVRKGRLPHEKIGGSIYINKNLIPNYPLNE